MKNSSKALVNKIQEFEFDQEEITNLDIVSQANNYFHVLYKNKGVNVKIIREDFLNRTYSVSINSNIYQVEIQHPLGELIKKMGYSQRSAKDIDRIQAPMPGIIIDIEVEKGQAVKAGSNLLVLEAMKMENVIKCPKDAVIKDIYVSVGQTVDKNKLLIDFE